MLSPLRDTGPVWERRHGRVGRQAGGAGGGAGKLCAFFLLRLAWR